MDDKLSQRLADAIEHERRNGILLTKQGRALLAEVVDSIGDNTNSRVRVAVPLRDVQIMAIDRVPEFLQLASKAYRTKSINGLMLLTVMPRIITRFCPPFENPPEY
jgi:hypothetical protein